MVDFFFYNLIFCRETGLSHEETSAFFSIMKAVFEFSISGEVRTIRRVVVVAVVVSGFEG